MPAPFSALTMLAVMCVLVCLILVVVIAEERQQLRKAVIAERARSALEGSSSPVECLALGKAPGAPERVKSGQGEKHSTPIHRSLAPGEELRQVGFSSRQIDRLLLYRAAYRGGWFQPDPLAPMRLAFARWLYQHKKLSG